MYEFMNQGKISFLKTYVENIQLSKPDIAKMKTLIDEWPKDIKISSHEDDIKQDWSLTYENKKLMDQATIHDDGTFEMIPEGPPVEEVDMIDHLRSQSTAIKAKDDLVKCIISLDTTNKRKHTLIKWLETKYSNDKPRTSHPEKIPSFCEYIGMEKETCDHL